MPEKILSKVFDILFGFSIAGEALLAILYLETFFLDLGYDFVNGRATLIGLAICFCIFISRLGVNIYCDILTELRELNKKNKS